MVNHFGTQQIPHAYKPG